MSNAELKPKFEGAWIPWSGGECPVPPETVVFLRYANGTWWPWGFYAKAVSWRHSPYSTDYNIVAYFVVPGGTNHPSAPHISQAPKYEPPSPAPQAPTSEREAFEADYARRYGYKPARFGESYTSNHAATTWVGWQARAALPPAVSERSDTCYAIEHAEYMAKAAEDMLKALNAEDELRRRRAESDDMDDDVIHDAIMSRCEAMSDVRECIYEFRKRRDRAALNGVDASPDAVDWRHIANEWANEATNASKYLKNIRDGMSTAEWCLELNRRNIKRIRALAAAAAQGGKV